MLEQVGEVLSVELPEVAIRALDVLRYATMRHGHHPANVLGYVSIERVKSRLRLTAAVDANVRASFACDVTAAPDFVATVPFLAFAAAMHGAKSATATIGGGHLCVRAGHADVTLGLAPGSRVPSCSATFDQGAITLSAAYNDVIPTLRRALWFAGTAVETRYGEALCGVSLTLGASTRVAGTDSRVAILTRFPTAVSGLAESSPEIVLSRDFVKVATVIDRDQAGRTVQLQVNDAFTHVRFYAGGFTIDGALVGPYAPLDRVVPTSQPTDAGFSVHRASLIAAMEALQTVSDRHSNEGSGPCFWLAIDESKDAVSLSVYEASRTDAVCVARVGVAKALNGGAERILLGNEQMLQTLDSFDSEYVDVVLSGRLSPVRIVDPQVPTTVALVMPRKSDA